ncbi:MAG TPA: hypothetical protein DCY48_00105 [Candidatus Magasanikbacteria bacterium]|nr:MAG: hypothetical protein A3I74_04870 [Candidatus Magasanikbacteria bacterium RIFCSPLOWO2_02_FULL_47_16]OGH79745.1 MAG: hypothetical protein A3C10_04020 [Candidatus Magasanikbacteria bacterium RIFCSPHIGHO2_02_FULL_48_18]OGH83076.1 MAG: hypothetical protein A3G08_02570 [Candidatus Magasanikbacteria bacterium RIFCSPLOWO2_12_FULL_47_9b]HAZ28169.1 hypothetical protein [Candidatus Magasanikbacteria bacterium]
MDQEPIVHIPKEEEPTNAHANHFLQIFLFVDDASKTGRVLSTAKIGEVYMSRLTIEPGIVTGNLYSKETNIMFFVERGSVIAEFEHIETKVRKHIEMKPGKNAVHVFPYVARAIKNVGHNEAVLIFFSNRRLRSGDDFEYLLV